MKLELITLTGPKFEENIYEVSLPTDEGTITVLPHHVPIVTLAVPGIITIRRHKDDSDDKLEQFATNGGIIEIAGDAVRLLVDEADHADDIVEAEARQALERAKLAKQEAKDQLELDKAEDLIDRAAVRLKVAELRRHRRPRA